MRVKVMRYVVLNVRLGGTDWQAFCLLSRSQTDSQVATSQHKLVKPELACGLAKSGQLDLQVSLQFHTSRRKQ